MTDKPISTPARVFAKIARAIDRGTLPPNIKASYDDGIITLQGPRPTRYSKQPDDRLVLWVKSVADPSHLFQRPAGRSFLVTATKDHPAYDAVNATYRIRGAAVYVVYYVEHECVELSASTSDIDRRTGLPVWKCRTCRKSLSVTEARSRGLVPPLR